MLNILQLQTKVFDQKSDTFLHIEQLLEKYLTKNIDFLALPEMFNCPYANEQFAKYAEFDGGYTYVFCQNLAQKYNFYLSAGSIAEKDKAGNIYNTAYVFDNHGNCIAKHRKIHLFDIDIKNGQKFQESDTLSAGDKITVFDTKWGKMGICICYDIRFPELIRLMALEGAQVIFIPAAFNHTTGPLHWELLFKSRAVDNQVFTIGTSPALDKNATYHSYGHSIVVSPWGKVLSQLSTDISGAYTSINLNEIKHVRQQLPLIAHRRLDIYDIRKNY